MRLFPENPHYVEFRGQPALLIGSGEHYGAVLNADFDYLPYLDTLARDGLNLVRVFSGTYRELPGEFGIQDNNLAPLPDQFVAPWRKAAGGRYDLTDYNPDYFSRLRSFISQAAERGIVVEVSLFCFWYNDALWEASPMHPANNLQEVGPVKKEQVYSLQNNDLLPYQEDFARRLADELKAFDNLYFEMINEPYSRHDHTSDLDWQHHIAAIIGDAERHLPAQHLIAINYNNRTQYVQPHPAVSICNFHYAIPEAVKLNYHLDLLIADDETGFCGQVADPYRREAWLFMLAGGGAFSHLDYSFTCQHPAGDAPIQGSTPGYGGADLRWQLGFMKRFLESAAVWKMQPYNEIFAWNASVVPAQVMGIPHERYVAYFSENQPGRTHLLSLPAGRYQVEWINPVTGNTFETRTSTNTGGYLRVDLPAHAGDLIMNLIVLS